MTTYLAGPMEGIPFELAQGWRNVTSDFLSKKGIDTKDPCRRKKFHDQPYSVNLAKKIVALDIQDINASNVVFANLLDRGEGKAWGSVCEITYAYYQGKPIVLLIEEGFHHPFLETYATEIYHTLEKALEAVVGFYG